MKKENHIINNPLLLLSFFKEINKDKDDLMEVEGNEIRFEFEINKFVDSATVIGGYWLNTIELLKMTSLLEFYNLNDIVDIKYGYVSGMRIISPIEQEHFYTVQFMLSKTKVQELPKQISAN